METDIPSIIFSIGKSFLTFDVQVIFNLQLKSTKFQKVALKPKNMNSKQILIEGNLKYFLGNTSKEDSMEQILNKWRKTIQLGRKMLRNGIFKFYEEGLDQQIKDDYFHQREIEFEMIKTRSAEEKEKLLKNKLILDEFMLQQRSYIAQMLAVLEGKCQISKQNYIDSLSLEKLRLSRL